MNSHCFERSSTAEEGKRVCIIAGLKHESKFSGVVNYELTINMSVSKECDKSSTACGQLEISCR
jgi:hypothetical protein